MTVWNSLRGLALGDAFGEQWFLRPTSEVDSSMAERRVAEGVWPWTDDTAMAQVLLAHLDSRGTVEQGALAAEFASAYEADPNRAYGGSMHGVLTAILAGEPWRAVTTSQFDGQGSWGNGAAMRVAPLGAWFAADLDAVVDQARLQALVTHAHPEAVAGAIAVAVAAATAVNGGEGLLDAVLDRTPNGEVATGLRRATRLRPALDPRHAAGTLGCGYRISAADTVPFAIWCAARHLDDLVEALWATASAGGDMDTTCAIVGGIVAARTGLDGVPAAWLAACEPLTARRPA
ncbi:ADP-ribosylglycohydrolase family protein [Kutzneria buriramensis]|uniref:ADP-ribosylglycohydrolase n=1 Tax=Kutzneria buriramensis TaxID=1045776 RepID=A0A3E0HYP1_9PSEU|nr:ADP-ribosylglycohydrolase family protein [Kutzneria buriramensis]REH51592.1 ADP-ribosylglycohydrolase [Kutzneria buriramensis]